MPCLVVPSTPNRGDHCTVPTWSREQELSVHYLRCCKPSCSVRKVDKQTCATRIFDVPLRLSSKCCSDDRKGFLTNNNFTRQHTYYTHHFCAFSSVSSRRCLLQNPSCSIRPQARALHSPAKGCTSYLSSTESVRLYPHDHHRLETLLYKLRGVLPPTPVVCAILRGGRR